MSRSWPGYNAVWRWHFYAGLFCIPFVLWLALTGSVYLFRPQVEALIDRPYAHLGTTGPRASIVAQAEAAVGAVPGATLRHYQLPATPDEAVQFVVAKGSEETRVYVDPHSLSVLKRVAEQDRLMNIVFRLHGELLLGDTGSYIVELAASWAIVMLLSGLFLWWPRGGGLGGVLYPRLRSGGRRFWRDLHGVTGFWVSFFALFLLLSGLPWAKSWGTNLKVLRSIGSETVVKQDWTTGSVHAAHDMAMPAPSVSLAPLDRLSAVVAPLGLAPPVLIDPPAEPGEPWTAKSDSANRPQRTMLTVDPATGAILSRRSFGQRPLLDRIIGYGTAAHEGQLFGWLNQLISLSTALGLILLAASSVVLWWRRRPDDLLGAPPAAAAPRMAPGFFGLLAGLGIFLPLLGISMLAVLLVERWLLPRRARHWLGLPAA